MWHGYPVEHPYNKVWCFDLLVNNTVVLLSVFPLHTNEQGTLLVDSIFLYTCILL